MGHQIIKQQNGKYSVYSSVTESIIRYDATVEELKEWYAKDAAEEAKKRTQDIIDRIEAGKRPYFQFTKSWDEVKSTLPKEWQDSNGE